MDTTASPVNTSPATTAKIGKRATRERTAFRLFSRRAAATALVLGAVLNAGAAFVNTAFLQGGPTAGNYVDALANHAPLGMAGVGLNIIGILLMLVGIIGLMQQASRRAPVAGRIAAWATGIGMVAFLCMNGALLGLYGMGSAGNAEAGLAADQLVGTSPAMLALLLPFLVGNAVGMVGAAVALLKSRITPLWVPISLLVFFVADFILPDTGWFDAHLIFVVFAVGAAWSLLRTPAAASVHGPVRGSAA